VERHLGFDRQILEQRKAVYEAAKQKHPERWTGNTRNWSPIETVWLNPENDEASST
jgi:putative transposase